MKCKSCKEDVPQKFAHAISINSCPLCGEEIMDSKLKVIFSNLKDIMQQAQEYPDEVADWFSSNYKMKKAEDKLEDVNQNSADILPAKNNEEVPTRAKESFNKFAKRAGVDVDRIKKAVEEIKGAAHPSEFVDDSLDSEMPEDFSGDNSLDSVQEKQVVDMFSSKGSVNSTNALEIEKLKRLRSQENLSRGGGMFRRSS